MSTPNPMSGLIKCFNTFKISELVFDNCSISGFQIANLFTYLNYRISLDAPVSKIKIQLKELHLIDNDFVNDLSAMETLGGFLETHTELQKFTFKYRDDSGNISTPHQRTRSKIIQSLIERNKKKLSLREFELGCFFSPKIISELNQFLMTSHDLQKISLHPTTSRFTSDSLIKRIADLLFNSETLRELDLNFKLGWQGLSYLMQAMNANLKTSLEVIKTPHNDANTRMIHVNDPALSTLLETNQTLKNPFILGANLDLKEINALLKSILKNPNSGVRLLDFTSSFTSKDETFGLLKSILERYPIELSLVAYSSNDNALNELAKIAKSLRLTLSYQLDIDNVIPFLNNPDINLIEMDWCAPIHSEKIFSFLRNNQTLTRINLTGINREHSDKQGTNFIAAIRDNKNMPLRVLEVHHEFVKKYSKELQELLNVKKTLSIKIDKYDASVQTILAIDEIHTLSSRNEMIAAGLDGLWFSLTPVIAFYRSNQGSSFKASIFPLLNMLANFANMDAMSLETENIIDRVLKSRYFAHVMKGNRIVNANASTSHTAADTAANPAASGLALTPAPAAAGPAITQAYALHAAGLNQSSAVRIVTNNTLETHNKALGPS